jgi:hypothetical protein
MNDSWDVPAIPDKHNYDVLNDATHSITFEEVVDDMWETPVGVAVLCAGNWDTIPLKEIPGLAMKLLRYYEKAKFDIAHLDHLAPAIKELSRTLPPSPIAELKKLLQTAVDTVLEPVQQPIAVVKSSVIASTEQITPGGVRKSCAGCEEYSKHENKDCSGKCPA